MFKRIKRIQSIGLPIYDSPDRKVHALAKINRPENACFLQLALALTTGSQYQKVWDNEGNCCFVEGCRFLLVMGGSFTTRNLLFRYRAGWGV